jgi:hypothetical protein
MKTIEWVMMAAFIGGLALSLYKVYLFLPQKPLADDDTTSESVALLERIMKESNKEGMSEEGLYEQMLTHPEFDPKHFWRFNENRLRHLIEHYRLKEPNFRL